MGMEAISVTRWPDYLFNIWPRRKLPKKKKNILFLNTGNAKAGVTLTEADRKVSSSSLQIPGGLLRRSNSDGAGTNPVSCCHNDDPSAAKKVTFSQVSCCVDGDFFQMKHRLCDLIWQHLKSPWNFLSAFYILAIVQCRYLPIWVSYLQLSAVDSVTRWLYYFKIFGHLKL